LKHIDSFVLEHHGYGSLLAIYDCLEEIGFTTEAYECDLEHIDELSPVFVAQLDNGKHPFFSVITKRNGQYYYRDIESRKKRISKEELHKLWTGYVLDVTEHTLLEKSKNKELKQAATIRLASTALLLTLMAYFITTITFTGFINAGVVPLGTGLILVKLFGLLVCSILIWNDIDGSNTIVQNICSGFGKSGCTKVINSSIAQKFEKFLSFSEIGFTYFLGSLIFLLIVPLSDARINLLALVSYASIVFISFSFIHQKFILKEWCLLCMLVQLCLVGEILLFFFLIDVTPNFHFSINTVLSLLLPFILIITLIKYVKPPVTNSKSLHNVKQRYNKLKYDRETFATMLRNSRSAVPPTENLGILKNSGSQFNLIKICNPYCGPCSSVHPILAELVKQKIINLRIIFTTRPDETSREFEIVSHLLAINEGNEYDIEEALNLWYSTKNYDLFAEKFKISDELRIKQKGKILKMAEWCLANSITHTPTLFFNNKLLPKIYDANDLKTLLD